MNPGPLNPTTGNLAAESALSLEASLQIQNVEREFVRLRQIFEINGATAIDVGGLTAIDTAGVQLLLAIAREGARRHLRIQFRGESTALTQALKLLGLEGALMQNEPP
jgi:anti-anti-sigma regulatory factor